MRGDLQQAGTEPGHRTIEQMDDRGTRSVEDCRHRISKVLVQYEASADYNAGRNVAVELRRAG